MSLREEKKAQTHKAIADAALQLFEQKGFDETTVDEIAAAAFVSRSTFFRYFETKEAVFFARHQAIFERFASLVRELSASLPTPFSRVERACLELARTYMAEREHMLMQHRIIVSSTSLQPFDMQQDAAWEQMVFEVLLDGRQDDPARRRRARVLASVALGVVRATLASWFEDDARGDLVALGRDAFAAVRSLAELPPQ